ncbi:oligosaccharide flippase family protein [Pseudomonas entomophila]|uniref:oligosaccharide flippase family protein n=1 Tax=Pseudomonas entomophila TaxID=312306 RepID=UPI00200C07A4|nr:oligosaccharide flippase family protein [Pseudomonas entomophila]
MSLKKNIIANYVSQIYVALIGIVILPLYMKSMGAEAYGLIGFFTMLQSWFMLLDLGLTPTVGRETARFKAGSMSAIAYRRLVRALNSIFLIIAVVGGVGLLVCSDTISTHWLKAETLTHDVVVGAVQIMAVCIALRWMGGLYRGVITGSERLVWLSGFNAVIASLRFIAVFFSMHLYGYTVIVFFVHQLVVAVIEFGGLLLMARSLLPTLEKGEQPIGWSFGSVRPLLKFALSIAFTSSVWVLVTQSDKMILSGVLPLAEYGYFTLAVLVASGIMVLSGPVSSAILPRMARLHAEKKSDEMIRLYRITTRFIATFIGSVTIVLAFCARPLLIIWTGDEALAATTAPVLSLYAWGNGFLALAAFPYYLQYARGDLKYHLVGSLATVCILVPAMVIAASKFGAVGAGWAWLLTNGSFLLIWVTYVHYKLEPGLQWRWLLFDCFKVVLPAVLVVWGGVQVIDFSSDRLAALAQVIAVGLLALAVSCSLSVRSILVAFKGARG